MLALDSVKVWKYDICYELNKKSSGQGASPYRWYSPRAARHDSVKLRSRQYSLDGRRFEKV